MLKKINSDKVRGPNFEVTFPNMNRIHYTEGDFVASVQIESGIGPNGKTDFLIYGSSLLGWEPPHAGDEMSPTKRDEIISKISLSLDLLGMPHRIE